MDRFPAIEEVVTARKGHGDGGTPVCDTLVFWFDIAFASRAGMSVMAVDELEAVLIATGRKRPHVVQAPDQQDGPLGAREHLLVYPNEAFYLHHWARSFRDDGYEVKEEEEERS